MQHERIILTIGGQELTHLYADLISLEVELDDELAGMLRLLLTMAREPAGGWRYLNDDAIAVWQPFVLAAGFENETEELLRGFITQIRPNFAPDATQCTLEIWGMDSSIVMDREVKRKAWPDKTDSDIATKILSDYGFTPQVDDTTVVHDAAVSTIIQRETDMQFLQRLALRNGFHCFVEGEQGIFQAPKLDAAPQPLLALDFGAESTITQFALQVDALVPASISMSQFAPLSKELVEHTIRTGTQRALGATTADALPTGVVGPGSVLLAGTVTTGLAELEQLCQALYHQASWFVTGQGEINANTYGHVLRPRRTVTIKGINARHNGVYYVNHVTHRFAPDGYRQSFQVRRNGLDLTGSENFSAGTGLFGSLL